LAATKRIGLAVNRVVKQAFTLLRLNQISAQ
jgi:hypothetical protein